ncbi:sodium:solute symporter [Calditrichota bacterium]
MDINTSYFYWFGFIIYSALVICVGLYVWIKEKKAGKLSDNQTFWTASKNLSGWSVGLSISASMMSISWSCVYGVQLFYWYGFGAFWLLTIPWLITMAGFFIFTPLFRKLNAFSQPELLEKKFGTAARQMLSPALIIVFITWTGAEIYAAGNIIAPFLGISVSTTLLLISIVVAIYSFTGGFEAVISTDKIQFTLVAIFITIIAIIGINAVSSETNPLNIMGNLVLPPKAKSDLIFFSPGIGLIVMTFIAYLPGWLIETDVWVRLQAGKSNKKARNGVVLASINSAIFVGILPLLIGLSALYIYPAEGGRIPDRLGDGALIFTVLMQDYAPVWLSVLLSIGLIAAAMSTIDTCGNIVALSFSYDLIEPKLQNKWTQQKLNKLARWMSVVAIFISYIYALFTESLWDIFYLSSGILTTTVFIPVISTFIKGTNKSQVHLSIIFGLIGTLFFYFFDTNIVLPKFIYETGLGYIVLGFICSILGFFCGKINFSNFHKE